MPLFNGNILQIHALLIAAYAGVAKGIANKGKKPDVCTTYPQQYEKWYSMDAERRHRSPGARARHVPLPQPGALGCQGIQ